jgi:DNA mismatch repair protein MutL
LVYIASLQNEWSQMTAHPVIQFLDELTINQIAAGEVIENPSSVVKELVENACDAGSTSIFVEIQAGGQELVRVQDNGKGMCREDALRSIGRHATSKIRTAEDLLSLATLGFRGEALSSITAVSECTIRTCLNTGKEEVAFGTSLKVSGGQVIACEEVALHPGTSVEVRSLFFNTPARKKFQKAPSKDTLETHKVMTQLALCHLGCGFDYVANFKKEFSVKPCSFDSYKERIAELLGNDFAARLKPVFYDRDGLKLRGFIGEAEGAKPTRAGQYLFINERPVSALGLSYAVKEAYGTALDKDRHPIFVLHLTINPHDVDVNVHPQKKEVRFKHEEQIRKMILEAVTWALFTSIPKAFLEPKQALFCKENGAKKNNEHEKRASSYEQKESAYNHQALPSWSQKEANLVFENFAYERVTPKIQDKIPDKLPGKELVTEQTHYVDLLSKQKEEGIQLVGLFEEYAFLKIFWGEKRDLPEFLLQQDVLYLVDMKACLLRLYFDEILEKSTGSMHSERLLVPYFMEVAPQEALRLVELLSQFSKIGFEIREFGKFAFLVEARPTSVKVEHIKEFILMCLQQDDEVSYSTKASLKGFERKSAAKLARRLSSQKSYPLSPSFSEESVKKWLTLKDPWYCPFGKPIVSCFTKNELQRKLQNSDLV